MRWPDVLLALATSAGTDPVLLASFGTIRLSGSKKHVVPSLDLLLVSDTEAEIWEPIVVQWSMYATSMENLIAGESRLRRLFVGPLAVTVGGVTMYTEFLEGVDLEVPTRDNVYARGIRIELQVVKTGLLR